MLEELAEIEIQGRLLVELARLPLLYRDCLLLVAGAGLTPQQAAQTLDLPAATLRKRLSRAREMLATRMGLSKTHSNEVG